MRILHTNFLHGWGGQSNRILSVCRGLAERGHDVLIAAPGDSELIRRARSANLSADGSMTFRRGFRPLALARDIRRMRRLLGRRTGGMPVGAQAPCRGGFDLVHTHGSQDSWVVALANLPKRLPVVRTKHNIFPIRDHFANRWLYGRAFDRVICISGAIVEQCAAKPYVQRDRLALVHSAVDLERFAQPDRARVEAWRSQWAGPQPVVAVVGRLRREKGHRFLLEAIAQLRRDFPAILLVVAGDGSLRAELEQNAAALGIRDHVRFLGFRTDVPEILAAADLFVLPSLAEGLGTAAIEAAAAGRPVVASRVGGLTDIIRDGETGRLVEPGDAAALTRAIAQLLADWQLAKRLAQAARRYASEHFTVAALVEKTEAVYAQMLENPGNSHSGSP